jgi:very-short-patch-repair endonuclease
MDPRDRALQQRQGRQLGLFTLAQALSSGFSRAAVRRRVVSGRWKEIDTRVYRVGDGLRATPRQALLARVLATRGAATGRSAAALYGWTGFPAEPEIIVRRRAGVRPTGCRITDSLPASDVAMVDGIPATRPARTLIELAAVLPRERFEDVVDTAVVSRVVTLDRLEKRARELRAPRRSGCAVVLDVVATRHPELARARNEMEARILRILDQLQLPAPRVNLVVRLRGETRIVDFAWPDRKVALELDGFGPHSTRRVFDDDRLRRNLFTAEGWWMFHVTNSALRRSTRVALALVIEALATP